jgi:hypothetical protein
VKNSAEHAEGRKEEMAGRARAGRNARQGELGRSFGELRAGELGAERQEGDGLEQQAAETVLGRESTRLEKQETRQGDKAGGP